MIALVLTLTLALLAVLLGDTRVIGRRAVPGGAPEMQRLQRYVARRGGRRRVGRRILVSIDRRLLRARAMIALERRLREAGIALTVSEALLLASVAAAAAGGGFGVTHGVAAGTLASAAWVGAAWLCLVGMRDRRVRRLDLQLPAALDLVIAQLRAHRSTAEALTEAAHRVSGPLGQECGRVIEEVRLGASLAQALDALRRRIPSRPLGTVVTAILVTDRTGGNLAEFLARQSRIVRDQVGFLQEVRAVTAHARATAAILTLLPIGVAAAMYLLDPGFFAPMLSSGMGRALLTGAATMELLGWLVIRAMIRGVER
jgi:tight adherence protein B